MEFGQYLNENGDAYESVTTFIGRYWDKSGLDVWRKRVGAKKAQAESIRTAARGKMIHHLVDLYINNQPLVFGDPVGKGLFMKLKPVIERIDNIRLLEKPIYSNELRTCRHP